MTMTPGSVLGELGARVLRLRAGAGAGRVIVGIVGVPGAGKTTLAIELVARLNDRLPAGEVLAMHVPMDGYHLADVELERLGLRDRKGAPATFDALGYVALLRRLRENADEIVYAPGFDRTIEQPIAGAIPIPSSVQIIVTEGNYLLLDGPWSGVRSVVDEVWFHQGDEELRQSRLLARHVQFGKTPEQARAWIAAVDQPNADLIAATAGAADLVVHT
jgi:pantothenate kinase